VCCSGPAERQDAASASSVYAACLTALRADRLASVFSPCCRAGYERDPYYRDPYARDPYPPPSYAGGAGYDRGGAAAYDQRSYAAPAYDSRYPEYPPGDERYRAASGAGGPDRSRYAAPPPARPAPYGRPEERRDIRR
jgi:hypothetical protein